MAPVETVSFDGLRGKSFSIVFSYFVCLSSLSDVRKNCFFQSLLVRGPRDEIA